MARILIGNIKGPKGDTGPQGKQGPTGPQGPKGDTGPMPALINNAATTSAGVGALDAAMGKTLNDRISQLYSDIQTGRIAGEALPIGEVSKKHVDFARPFSARPAVLLTIYSDSDLIEYKDLTISVCNTSTTGFDVNIYNGSNKGLIPYIEWAAVSL